MNSQALIFNQNNEVLMVRQYVKRGALVWNYPGGNIEHNESGVARREGSSPFTRTIIS